MNLPSSPLTRRDERLIEANSLLDTECPNPDCDRTVDVVDLADDGSLYVAHEDDRLGMGSRSDRGETDGCTISATNDPTLDN
jgi:hypothetical protein